MGYPMTFRRVLSRNGIFNTSAHWQANVNMNKDHDSTCGDIRRERLERFKFQGKLLLDDISRLIHDTLDELTIVSRISERTNLDKDIVAGVLKEYLAM